MKILALALVLFLVPQDEKITFKFAPKQGDKLSRTKKVEFKLAMEVDAGGEVHPMELEQRQTEKTVTEFTGVADGKVTRKVIDFSESFEEKKGPPANEWERKDNALHGRKVTVFLKDGQPAYEGGDGLAEKELQKIQLADPLELSYPKAPVAIGESWELKDDEVRKFLESDQKFKKATLKMKLASVKEIDKRRCALIKATLDLTTIADEGVEVGATIEGDLVIWIERGHLLDFKGKGKMTIKSDNEQMSLSGKGDITLDFTTKVE